MLIKEILNSVQQVGIPVLTIFLNQILICRKGALKYVAQDGVNLRLLPEELEERVEKLETDVDLLKKDIEDKNKPKSKLD